jgi:hypothetical protein
VSRNQEISPDRDAEHARILAAGWTMNTLLTCLPDGLFFRVVAVLYEADQYTSDDEED